MHSDGREGVIWSLGGWPPSQGGALFVVATEVSRFVKRFVWKLRVPTVGMTHSMWNTVNLLPKTGLSWRDTRAFCNTHQNVGKIPPFPSIFDAEARLQQWIGESHLVIFRFAVNRDDAVGRFELSTSGRPPACWVRNRGPCYAPHCVCAPQSDSGPRVNHRGLRKNSAARHFFRHKERQLKHWCWWAWSAIILGNDGCMARELSNISRSTRLPIYPNMSTHEETLIV
jgi:hypothetical protein